MKNGAFRRAEGDPRLTYRMPDQPEGVEKTGWGLGPAQFTILRFLLGGD